MTYHTLHAIATEVTLGGYRLRQLGDFLDDENMEKTSTTASWLMGLILGMLLYFILIVYGQQVLQSVIDEKQTRVLDVMVTSCTPFELMMGKILGIAVVAALQIQQGVFAVVDRVHGIVVLFQQLAQRLCQGLFVFRQ